MKKTLCLLLALLMLGSMLAGCASTPAEPDNTTDNTQQGNDSQTQDPTHDQSEANVEQPASDSVTGVDRDKANAIEAVEEGALITDADSIHTLWVNSSPYNFAKLVDNYPADTAYPLVDEPTTLSCWMGWSSYASGNGQLETPNDSPAFKEATEKTGITIKWTLSNDIATQFPLLLASEEYTDMFINGNVAGQLNAYLEDEIIYDLTDLIPTYAPNYHALRMDDFDFARRSITDDGRLLGMYGVQPVGSLSFWSPVARTDWVGDLDPYTYDDWHELLVNFRDEHNCPRPYMLDPNGQDTYMMAGFNVGASWIVIDGEVRHSITEDGYVEYLNLMRQWYEEGLINSSFYQDIGLVFDHAFCATDEVGVFCTGYQYLELYESYNDDPNFHLAGLRIPVKEKGDKRLIELSVSRTRIMNELICVFSSCQNPELAVQYMDFWFSPEGAMLKGYGVEGESYYLDEDGIPMLSDMILNPTDPSMNSNIWRNLFIADYFPGLMDWTRDMKGGMSEYSLEAPMKWDYNWVDTISFPKVTRTQEETEDYSFIMSDIETRINETIVHFITGEKSMDEWDAFLDELNGMGLDDARQIQQQAYDRFMAR